MKKIITATLVVALFGIFTVFATPNNQEVECASNCCKTEACKQECVLEACCEEDKTCDVSVEKECKQKCCDTTKESCDVATEKACCETK